MSYMAKYKGTFIAKRLDDVNKLIDTITDADFFVTEIDDTKLIVSGQFDNYKEDVLFSLYNQLIADDLIFDAEIEFNGEQDDIWKHEIKDGQARELNGNVSYQDIHDMKGAATRETVGTNPYAFGIRLSSGKYISANDLQEILAIQQAYDGYNMLAYYMENADYDFDLEDVLSHVNKSDFIQFCQELKDDYEDILGEDSGSIEYDTVHEKFNTFMEQQEIEWEEEQEKE